MVVDQEFSVEDVNVIVDAHIPNIVWPFLIIAVVNFLTAFGFICLSIITLYQHTYDTLILQLLDAFQCPDFMRL